MDSKPEEYLREEALKFVDEVRETFLHHSDSGNKWGQFLAALNMFYEKIMTNEALVQTLIDLFHGHENLLSGYRKFVPTGLQKSREFFKKAEKWFEERDYPEGYRDLVDSVIAHGDGRLGREELYGKVCTSLTGNAGLFSQFESTFFVDGSEETKREVEVLRAQIKQDYLRYMAEVFEMYESTIKTLKEAPPKKLTAVHRSFIREVVGGDYHDSRKGYVLARLEKKYKKLRSAYDERVLPYMRRVFSRPIDHAVKCKVCNSYNN